MSVFKSQFSRALRVIKSDYANIPFPATAESGTNTSAATNQLIDSAAQFITNNVKPGDIVYNISDALAATVESVPSEDLLVLNADIFTASGKIYVVYQASSQTTIGNAGCMLYVGGAGNVNVLTIGGDEIVFNAVPAGTILPVQVLKLYSQATTATLVNALW